MTVSKHLILALYLSCLTGFTLYDDLIPLTFNNELVETPFSGGFNRPKIQWLDWDVDGDKDLFLLDASGYIRYLENQGSINTPDFHIKTSEFQDIHCGGWFYLQTMMGMEIWI